MNADLSKIIDLINKKEFLKAILQIGPLISKQPRNYELNKIIGVAYLGNKNFISAIAHLTKCFEYNKKDFQVIINLSYSHLQIQEYNRSMAYSKNAMMLDNQNPSSYQNLANAYYHISDFDQALNYSKKTIEIYGGNFSEQLIKYSNVIILQANILLALKKFEEFEKFCLSYLNKNIILTDLAKLLIRHNRELISETHLEMINAHIKLEFKNNTSRVEYVSHKAACHFALAEYFDGYKKNESEKNYHIANDLIKSIQRKSSYDRQKLYKNIKFFFEKNFHNYLPNTNVSSKNNIFILGMPRSGTTLVESILSTAENVLIGGERVFFLMMLEKFFSDFNNELIFEKSFFDELAKGYFRNIELSENKNCIYVDKMPANFLYFGFIKMALPHAKFIHVKRNSWDNAISLYKSNYRDNIPYASSFFDIASEYANYEMIINFWKNIFGQNCFIEVKYEDIVNHTDDFVKKIWRDCDLSGHYSSERRKEHYSSTASKQQVNKEIFQHSLKKRDFEDQKDIFFETLDLQKNYWSI